MDVLGKIREFTPRLRSGLWQPVLPPPIAILELGLLFAAILMADWLLPDVGVTSLEPSPYWLPVLLLTLQYGTVAGLVAAACATLAHVLAGFPEQGIGENLFAYFLKIWALPMLWIGIALVLGQFRLRQIEVKRRLQKTLISRSAEASELATYARNLEDRCHKLERALSAGKGGGTGGVLQALTAISSPAMSAEAILAIMTRDIFPGAAMSIFTISPSGLDLLGQSGWPGDAGWSRSLSQGHPLYSTIVSERRPWTLMSAADEAHASGEGLAACPIFSPDSGRVAGMLKLERTDATQFDDATVDYLVMLARLIAPALAELRVVVDNSARSSAEHGRLIAGWQRHSWSSKDGQQSPASEAAHATIDGDRSSRPTRAT